MNAVGTVVETKQNSAVVTTKRSSACASCHNCEAHGACHAELVFGEQESTVVVVADNRIGANVGDLVELSVSTGKTLMLSALVFLVPLIVSVLLYLLVSCFLSNTTVYALVFICSFIVTFFVVSKLMNIYAKKNIKAVIVKILEEN